VLGASLSADREALQNDLEQAKELAADFQRQLSGKSNEVAHFKNLLEKTQKDLNRLDLHVQELRRERHHLANEAMRATALDAQLKRANEEVDELRKQVDTLRDSGGNRVEELLLVGEEQQAEIKRLRAVVEVLKKRDGASVPESGQTQRQINELTTLVKELQGRLDKHGLPPRVREVGEPPPESEVINLSFDR
jgi:chromosome segregation ATPase